MAKTLGQYIIDTRRLLHDSTGNYWQDSELTDYVNEARNRTVADTGCNRILQTFNLVAAQEVYPFSALPKGNATFDVLNITVYWGSQRVPLDYMPFTKFNTLLRSWQTFTSRPTTFSVYGQDAVYVAPVPDQNYVTEWDTVVEPVALSLLTDTDTIKSPYNLAVPFYAAYMAKYKEQSFEQADKFLAEFEMRCMTAVRSTVTRRIPSALG